MLIPSFLFVISDDPSLGKVDKASFSQQTLMELFIANFTNKEKICGSDDNPKDIYEWEGWIDLNASHEIIEIDWRSEALEGSVELKWLPLSSISVTLSDNFLTGTVDLTCLPDIMNFLSLSDNQLEGTVDLTRLPPQMKRLFLNLNKFCGSTDFSQLPQSLTHLDVSCTHLEGEIYVFDGDFLKTTASNVKDIRNL